MSEEAYQMNDWSFTQLCQLAKVSRDTVNRVTADTAWRVFGDTLPTGNKPLQLYTEGNIIRSIHGVSYTRLYNADILAVCCAEFATDFQPPQRAAFGGKDESGGGTGLYAGEQDMFCFLIDPTGWAEINGQAFAPGFFIWNSEVGKRSLGIETFWFQAVCQNHIVWDATEVVEFTRKHTASIHDSLAEMRRIVEQLVAKRDERRDGFVKVIAKAMHERLGNDAEEVMKVLLQHGINRVTGPSRPCEIAPGAGWFHHLRTGGRSDGMAGELKFAGERARTRSEGRRSVDPRGVTLFFPQDFIERMVCNTRPTTNARSSPVPMTRRRSQFLRSVSVASRRPFGRTKRTTVSVTTSPSRASTRTATNGRPRPALAAKNCRLSRRSPTWPTPGSTSRDKRPTAMAEADARPIAAPIAMTPFYRRVRCTTEPPRLLQEATMDCFPLHRALGPQTGDAVRIWLRSRPHERLLSLVCAEDRRELAAEMDLM